MSIFTDWGSTPQEHEKIFRCDDFLTGNRESYFRAIDINAPAKIVFRWLCQMKIAPYSYDKLDNKGKKSPLEITQGAENLTIGDKMMTIFSIVDFKQNEEITLLMDMPPDPYKKLYAPTAITYKIFPSFNNPHRSRLVVKYSAVWDNSIHEKLERLAVIFADFIMMRKQLLNFKKLAENTYKMRN